MKLCALTPSFDSRRNRKDRNGRTQPSRPLWRGTLLCSIPLCSRRQNWISSVSATWSAPFTNIYRCGNDIAGSSDCFRCRHRTFVNNFPSNRSTSNTNNSNYTVADRGNTDNSGSYTNSNACTDPHASYIYSRLVTWTERL